MVQGKHGAVQQFQDQDGGERINSSSHSHHKRALVATRLWKLLMCSRKLARKFEVSFKYFLLCHISFFSLFTIDNIPSTICYQQGFDPTTTHFIAPFFTSQTYRLCITSHSRVAGGLCWVKTIKNQHPSGAGVRARDLLSMSLLP